MRLSRPAATHGRARRPYYSTRMPPDAAATETCRGGIDLVLGCEDETGLRWPELALQGGRLNYPALRDALPQRHGVSVLSGSRIGSEIEAVPLGAVIDAGNRGGATVICDLPRRS